MYVPPSITFTIRPILVAGQPPGPGGQGPSFFDLDVLSSNSSAVATGMWTDAWCMDRNSFIYSGSPIAGVFYDAKLYSTAMEEWDVLKAAMPLLAGGGANIDKLDSINWLLNSYYKGTLGPTGTWQNVQGAMWNLIGQPVVIGQPMPANLSGGDATAMAALEQLARTQGDNYVADQGQLQYLGVIADPKLVAPAFPQFNGRTDQPLILPVLAAKLGDFVWLDANANGLQDGDEVGVNGVTVTLFRDLNNSGSYDAGDLLLGTKVTGDNPVTTNVIEQGYYEFNGLTPGFQYQVQFMLPVGYGFTTRDATDGNPNPDQRDSDANIVTGAAPAVTLAPGEFNSTLDAGLRLLPPPPPPLLASLGDRLWVDTNADGKQNDGATGIVGATVTLIGGGADGVIGTGADDTTTTTTTGVDGIYNFAGLTPGVQYQVQFTDIPAGTVFTAPNVSANGFDLIDSDAIVVDGKTQIVTLAQGEYNPTLDAGVFTPAKLSGFVYQDAGNDGIRNTEPAIAGVLITLTGTDGLGNPVTATTTTNAAGFYEFVGLLPGSYTVTESQPGGFLDGKDTAGTPGGGTASNDVISTVTLVSGTNSTENNFGELPPARLSGYVYQDAGNDGIRNAEPAIAGVTITLTGTNDLGQAVSATTTTNAAGFYEFANLRPGTYRVNEAQPAAFLDGKDTAGSTGGTVTNDQIAAITLVAGANSVENNFGELVAASLGDRLWIDANANGQQDGTEVGIVGQTITLIGGGADGLINGVGDTTTTTTTGANGIYGFTGLTPGVQYQVQFSKPVGTVYTGKDIGADGTDSDADTTTGRSQIVTLVSGENNLTIDAGVYTTASLGDRLWIDANANGQQDGTEVGIVGQTITLIGGGADGLINGVGDTTTTTTTGANGIYNFSGLTPGVQYQVQFSKPVGTVYTGKDIGADGTDSDADTTTGNSQIVTLASGENNTTLDAGVYSAGIDIEKLVRGEYMTGGTGGTEGLTPGFWKTHSASGPAPLAGWPETGYSPTQSWEAVFGLVGNATVPGTPTLLDALGAGGGGVNALLRHSTAALLNAANPNVDYLFTVASIISSTQAAILSGNATTIENLKNQYANQNELGADLSTPAPAGTMVVTPDVDADTVGSGPQIPVGGTAVFTYIVKNLGTVEISNVRVTDDRLTTLTFVGGDLDGDNKLDATETWTYTARETVTSSANITNIGTVTGTGGVIAVTDSDAANYNGSAQVQSLGDFVWTDANANGRQDANELGLAGLTITLIGGGADGLINGVGDTTASTTTDADGFYSFNSLASGVQYQVQFSKPVGSLYTLRDNLPGNDVDDSDADRTTGRSQIVTLAPGQNNPTLDAGVFFTASLGDRLWNDTNANGIQDTGETGIVGQTITLIGGGADGLVNGVGDTSVTTTTGTNGIYSFTGLTPGVQYQVQFSKPANTVYSTRDVSGNTLDATDSDVDTTTGRSQIVTLSSGENNITIDAGVVTLNPRIDIEKTTSGTINLNAVAANYDNEDTADGVGVPLLNPGMAVTWTYQVTNTGNTSFARADIAIVDDNSTVGTTADDMTIANGRITYQSGDTGADNILSPGEVWLYRATGTVQTLSTAPMGSAVTIDMQGNTALDGTDGNTRLYTSGAVSVNVNAFSRDKANGSWATAYVGSYGGGLGVTDSSEGTGAGDTHTTDNTGGRDNYIVYRFNQDVVVDSALLGYVVGDSDVQVWIGTIPNAFTAGVTLNDATLTALGFNEVNLTTLTTTRTADFNAGNRAGNVLVIAADTTDTTPDDFFKIQNLTLRLPAGTGVYSNLATVTAPGAPSDSDRSHYKNPALASLGDRLWTDTNANGIQDTGETGIVGQTITLIGGGIDGVINGVGDTSVTTTTGANGIYNFNNLAPGVQYQVQFSKPTNTVYTTRDVSGNTLDATDSDVDTTTGRSQIVTLTPGQNNVTIDAGVWATASLGDRLWNDTNSNGIQDTGETGIVGQTITLIGGGADGLINGVGDTSVTTTTGTNGVYGFTGLTPGVQYQVQFSKPTNTVFTTRDASGNTLDATDSDVDTTTGRSQIVTLSSGQNNITIDAGVAALNPRIDIEKTTSGTNNLNSVAADYNNEDTPTGAGVPLLTPGTAVTWTYQVTNTGNSPFARSVISIVDDNGTVGNAADDMTTTNGRITYLSGDTGNDSVLSPGEVWLYRATGTVLTLPNGAMSSPITIDMQGNTALDGTDGNTRSFTSGAVSVNVGAFSRDKTSGGWATAYLGAYGGGLGVTDNSEGAGANNTHTVDNTGGRDNYIVYRFNQDVIVDSAFLGFVAGDSDAQMWIGSVPNAFTAGVTLTDTVLANLGFTEVNVTDLTTNRTVDFNAGNRAGNVLVIAADTTDISPEDFFKVQSITLRTPGSAGVYSNLATVTAPGAPSDSDLSHYRNPALASLGDFVWEDRNFNGIQDNGEAGIGNVTVRLLNSANGVLATTTTSSTGAYSFTGLNPGDYKVQVVAPTGYFISKANQGANDGVDSDIDSTGTTALTNLAPGENDPSWDAGLYRKASVGDKVWEDRDHDDIQDATEPGIGGIKVFLLNSAGTQIASTTTNTSGNYLFGNLDPGVYQLRFDKGGVIYAGINMSTWMWASKDIGADDAIDSDVTGDGVAKTDVTVTSQFTLVSGQNDMTRDAGITPIVIDLDGNGIQTLSRAGATAGFDLFGNGTAVLSGWISSGDGFLAIDKNGNGKIDSITEMFGGTAKGAGFAQLAEYDSNGDGVVDARDAAFDSLVVWRDLDGNRQTDAGELMTLAQAGVASLTVAYTEVPFVDAQGNLHLERSSATLADGRSVDMTDVYFNVDADAAAAAGVKLPSLADLLGGDTLDGVLGAAHTGRSADMSFRDMLDSSVSETGELLRRLTEAQRESHVMILS